MKNSKIVTYVGVVAVASLGIAMAITNPSQQAYEAYAAQRLREYLKSNVCPQVPNLFGVFLQRNCSQLVDSSQVQMQQLVAQTTQRQNFIFFSIYRTNLAINPVLPGYRFETVGVFQRFFTYTAEQQ